MTRLLATVVTGSLSVVISGMIFAASTPLTLLPDLWGNLADLAILGGTVLLFCLRDLLSRRQVVRGVTKLCVALCWPAIVASSEMEWIHELSEQCYLRFQVNLDPGLLVLLLTLVIAGCLLMQIQIRGAELRRELTLREADEDEIRTAFTWQLGTAPILMTTAGLLMYLFLVGQNLAPIQRFAQAAADRLPPGLTAMAGVMLMVLIVGAFLVETE